MNLKDKEQNIEFHVGQRGNFTLLDSFLNHIENVTGEIVQLMDGANINSTYGMILTVRGIRPARLK